jgi:hypothetical protein
MNASFALIAASTMSSVIRSSCQPTLLSNLAPIITAIPQGGLCIAVTSHGSNVLRIIGRQIRMQC